MPIQRVPCPFDNCDRLFANQRGVNAHVGRKHKARFVPYDIHYDAPPEDTFDIRTEHIDQEPDNQDQYFYDQEEQINEQNPIIQNIPEAQRYYPFTHEQWWILNWMHNALVSQAQQNKFYKVRRNTPIYTYIQITTIQIQFNTDDPDRM
jgi:hypothetical protein